MAKELLIVFIYDTKIALHEEEDPQSAIVYFHPSWVNANQRMALCGQLMGVTQFMNTSFSCPFVISLDTGKFAIKEMGQYILCVGSDRNIVDWIVIERCKILSQTVEFFHADLISCDENRDTNVNVEKLVNAMEVYLPVVLYAGNILGNNLTVRLPKSASSIFLEAAQILECLQGNGGVYGGSVFYQNKVIMSQFGTDLTKQIAMLDPYRIKVPGKYVSTPFHLPMGVQLLTVHTDVTEIRFLEEHKIPVVSNLKNVSHQKNLEIHNNTSGNVNYTTDVTKDVSSRICTVVEEETETEHTLSKTATRLSQMPDVVKDTVRTNSENTVKPSDDKQLDNIKVESFIVNSYYSYNVTPRHSIDNLDLNASTNTPVEYFSFIAERKLEVDEPHEKMKNKENRNLKYYNTISDPLNPWFRRNGLPVSKSLRDHQITLYCRELDDKTKSAGRKYDLKLDSQKQASKTNRTANLTLRFKKELTDTSQTISVPPADGLVTPLMSKLSLLHLSQHEVNENSMTHATSLGCLNDVRSTLRKRVNRDNSPSVPKSRSQKNFKSNNQYRLTQETILFVFGHQNISFYLLLNTECLKNSDLIYNLWKTCVNSVQNLERSFQQCSESMSQPHSIKMGNDSYSYLNIHSQWETLQYGGIWNANHLDVANSIRHNFDSNPIIIDINIRLEDNVVYGNRLADNRVVYQQSAGNVAGLPMPSDLMGTIPLKAKRRLERDCGILIV